MPYGHLISATVMTVGVPSRSFSDCKLFSILTGVSGSPSAITELLADKRCILRVCLVVCSFSCLLADNSKQLKMDFFLQILVLSRIWIIENFIQF